MESSTTTASTAPLAGAALMGFAPTRDLAKSRPFYERQLGLAVLTADPQGIHFAVGPSVLRLQLAGEFAPQRFTVLGWTVASIEDAVERLVARGVAFERFAGLPQDAQGVMTFPDGARVAWFKDPDGNVLSLAQLPR